MFMPKQYGFARKGAPPSFPSLSVTGTITATHVTASGTVTATDVNTYNAQVDNEMNVTVGIQDAGYLNVTGDVAILGTVVDAVNATLTALDVVDLP